ncbi:sugar phosphate nucleotidyltransferase [Bacillus wiedmannii]|uniref:sugar phosphate nucleotidyltransferase n=1 Tax=Bacillus wiedmannii TaxID=1890302 RepID=UPI003557D656
MRAVIMAGGKGIRLHPYTKIIPKPLIPLNEIPILEVILRQLQYHGFTHVTLTLNYKARLIQTYFGDGKELGLNIDYTVEDKEMGTIGPLTLIENLNEPFLLMNADILTDLDFSKFYKEHIDSNAIGTVMLYNHSLNVDFGVVERNSIGEITDYLEKPSHDLLISSGIYMLNPESIFYLNKDEEIGAPEFLKKLIKSQKIVKSYTHEGVWMDIGTKRGLDLATDFFQKNKNQLLNLSKENLIEKDRVV